MSDKKYSWDGDWEGPESGGYVIIGPDGGEMHPGKVVEMLDAFEDLREQVIRRWSDWDKASDEVIAQRWELWRRMGRQ